MLRIAYLTFILVFGAIEALSQTDCSSGQIIGGRVLDSTRAVIVDTRIVLDGTRTTRTNKAGEFSLGCVAPGAHTIVATVEGFAESATDLLVDDHGQQSLSITLRPAEVLMNLDVSPETMESQGLGGGPAKELSSHDIEQLADDPDELERQLRVLAATAGGAPSVAMITVDGFQTPSHLPPKAAISYIRINPDLFSAEYTDPPYDGARIEVYTKAGQDRFHGSVFGDFSERFLNAKDPFAPSKAAISRRRLGFDLVGPILKKHLDFSLGLEHRQIDDFSVINAISLDNSGNPLALHLTAPVPQYLWRGNASLNWLVAEKQSMFLTFTSNVSSMDNVGVGGNVLIEHGYSTGLSEHAVRLSHVYAASDKSMNEAKLGIQATRIENQPNLRASELIIAGSVTAGGAPVQDSRESTVIAEVDNYTTLIRGRQSLKFGVQSNLLFDDQTSRRGFNGSFLFGGGLAPELTSQQAAATTVQISGLEQYRRALLGLPGGSASTYSISHGNPSFGFSQTRIGIFIQDQVKLSQQLQLSLGFRYSLQTAPTSVRNFGPRAGLSWSVGKERRWVLRGRVGLFQSPIPSTAFAETLRLDGEEREAQLFYSPNLGNPTSGGKSIATLQQFAPNTSQNIALQGHVGVEHDLGRKWHAQANMYLIRGWDTLRTLNVNSPFDGNPFGMRPGKPAMNIFQFQQSGSIGGNIFMASVDHASQKKWFIFAAYIRNDLRSRADGSTFSPQSAFSDEGEKARQSTQITHRIITVGQLTLPKHTVLSSNLDLASGLPFNFVTGTDTNGDGIFNDRPRYGNVSDPNTIITRYGPLTNSGGFGVVPRNTGTMPWTLHLDANLSHSFSLGKHSKQAIAINLRSTNLLNHTNVTSVGGVLGSSFFGTPVSADKGRRIEIGGKWSF